MSPAFALKLDVLLEEMHEPLYVATLLSDSVKVRLVFPSYLVVVEGRELVADLMVLLVLGFDIILGMDWLVNHYATLDC